MQALLSLSEGKEQRLKKSRYSSHVPFESPDYNLPLTSIATRFNKHAPMNIDNPMTDFEMAREVREETIVQPLDLDAVPSTEEPYDESF